MDTFLFDLPSLPLELQLLVVQHCVLSNYPMVNIGKTNHRKRSSSSKYPVKPICHTKNIQNFKRGQKCCRWPYQHEPHGQEESAINITLTCRTFHTEGRKLFWAHNVFRFDSLQWLQTFLPEPRCTWIRHLCVHVGIEVGLIHQIFLDLYDHLRVCKQHPALKTLQIHFVAKEGSYSDLALPRVVAVNLWTALYAVSDMYSTHLREQQDSENNAVQQAQEDAEADAPVHDNHQRRSKLALTEFIITGLPGNNELRLDALVLRIASTAVDPQRGKIGLGMGDEGRQFWTSPGTDDNNSTHKHGEIYRLNEEPKIEWVQAGEEVDKWVCEHAWDDAETSAKSVEGAALRHLLRGEMSTEPLFKGWL